MWASVAGSWRANADFVDARHAAVAQRMLATTTPGSGERVLELACGPGGVGLAAAPRVIPGGHVVLSDVVAEMTAVAADRATAARLGNVSTKVLDIEDIAEDDESYDVVVCRDGLQFALDPGAAAGEIRRVLRPGGRCAVVVWGPRARNPWLGGIFDAVSAVLGRPTPPPGHPGPFSLDDATRLADILQIGMLADVNVSEISVPLRAPSLDAWWKMTTELGGPLAKMFATLPPEQLDAIQSRAFDAAKAYERNEDLELPGVALLASARRA
jgi:SAM-dependent methyltransferase